MDFEEIKEQWEDLESWKKLLITIFFSGVIVYIIYMFLVEEKLTKVKNLENEITELKNKIDYLKRYTKAEKLNQLNQKIKSIKLEISQKEKELERYKKIIPDKPFTENILIQVSKVAEVSGIELESFSVKEKKVVYAVYRKDINRVVFKNNLTNGETGIKLNKISFDIKATGTMENLYKFLKNLVSTKRIIILDSVDISKIKGSLAFDIKFSSYYMED